VKECRVFYKFPYLRIHHWLYLGKIQVVTPKLGEFDPRNDEQRKATRYNYVCVDCGKEKTESIIHGERIV
jgi:hypothetical protein